MIKLYRIIFVLSFVSLIPSSLYAQQRFEISAGISTPGYHAWETGITLGEQIGIPDEYKYRTLSDMERDAYKSSYRPGYSIQAAYKLADHGFTKRLSVLGYAGLNMVDFEKIDYLTNKPLYNETACRYDILFGIRYHIVTKKRFMMYTQIMAGGHIDDDSKYWEYNYYLRENPAVVQVTFLGFRFKAREDGGFCFLADLGTGSEYQLAGLLIIPGVRLGLGYTF